MNKTMASVWAIVGFVFSLIGGLFTALGVAFYAFIDEIAASPNSEGNVEILPYVFCAIGIITLLVGIICWVKFAGELKRTKRLKEEGRYVTAEITDIYENGFVTINGRHPYLAVCTYSDPYTGENQTFRSGNLRECGEELIGRQVKVYIDPQDSSNYYVDMEALLRRYQGEK